MVKRKELDEQISQEHDSVESSSGESSSDDDTNMLEIDFEWFDPQPDHDFHGLKTLLRQLLDVDAQLFDLSALTDLILAQPLLGSTVKVEGNETDPYAFLSVLNLYEHRDKPVIQSLTEYLKSQALRNPALMEIKGLLAASSEARLGLILTERLINIPSEVVPPMYNMLLEEISWAIGEREPYNFTHYLIMSKTYQEVQSSLDEEDGSSRKTKKQKKSGRKDSETFYFHPEDQILKKHASLSGSFDYTVETGGPDSKRTFQDLGIKPAGLMILIEARNFEIAVQGLQTFFHQG